MNIIHEIEHRACGRDANKARGEAKFYISIEATH